MRSSSSTEFTATEGRRFAFPVGVAFLLLAGVLLWRDKTTLMWVGASLGGVLIVAGLVAPAHLGPVYRAWMRMALAISKVTTPVFMGVVYYVVFTPSGLIMRLLGRKPIEHPLENGGFWRPPNPRAASSLKRQF